MDYENTKTHSMHGRLGSTTLSQMASPRESNLSFPWEKSQWDNIVVLKKKNDMLYAAGERGDLAGGRRQHGRHGGRGGKAVCPAGQGDNSHPRNARDGHSHFDTEP